MSITGLLRVTGVRGVTPLNVLLPYRWESISLARAEAFRHLAIKALQEGRYNESMLALATAEDTAPGTNLDLGLITLRLAEQRREYIFTDKIHQHLTKAYPDQRQKIDLNYHDALLISGRWSTLAKLSLSAIAQNQENAGPWLRTLALALQRLPSKHDFAENHTVDLEKLPPDWRDFVEMLISPSASSPDLYGQHGVLFASIAIEHAARTGDVVLASEAFGALARQPDLYRDLRLQNLYRLRFDNSSRDPSALRLTLVDAAGTADALQVLISDALRSDDPEWLAAISSHLPAVMNAECAGDLWLAAKILGTDNLRLKAEKQLLSTGRVPQNYFHLAKNNHAAATDWTEWITVIPCSREMLRALAEIRPE